MAIVFECIFVFLFSHHQNIILSNQIKSNQKIGKTRNYPCAWKSYSTSRTGIGFHKKKEVIINSKTATLSYFDKWKQKQQGQSGKYFYFSFILNSDRMIILPYLNYVRLPSQKNYTASSVSKILSFWNKFRIIMYFLLYSWTKNSINF